MYLNLLHVDNALKQQSLFLEQCKQQAARETEAEDIAGDIRLWGKDAALASLSRRLATSLYRNGGKDTLVTFMGSGDFHHVSALLIAMLAQSSDEPFTVIHFDNHPDWVKCARGMHCGSWVNRALELPQVAKVITLGVCSRDLIRPQFKRANLQALREGKIVLFPWQSPSAHFRKNDISAMDPQAFLDTLASLIPTRNVYITIDKDVLSPTDALTNWDQGRMELDSLIDIVQSVLSSHHAIGIDINGDYSTPHYGTSKSAKALKKLEAMIDQPKRAFRLEEAVAINQKTNLTLLNCLREVL